MCRRGRPRRPSTTRFGRRSAAASRWSPRTVFRAVAATRDGYRPAACAVTDRVGHRDDTSRQPRRRRTPPHHLHPWIHLPSGGFGTRRVRRDRVLCTASVTEGVPRWRKGSGLGWLTAEYAMLPSSTHERSSRGVGARQDRRPHHEISRLVGRSLRPASTWRAGENTIAVDCDVLQADGGTRTASITGRTWPSPMPSPGWGGPANSGSAAALVRDRRGQRRRRRRPGAPGPAVRGGFARRGRHERGGHRRRYPRRGAGYGEGATFPRATLEKLLDMAEIGTDALFEAQREALALPYPVICRVPSDDDPAGQPKCQEAHRTAPRRRGGRDHRSLDGGSR